MRLNCTMVLLDVATNQDVTTGENTLVVAGKRKLLGEKTEVGMQTFWNAMNASVRLDFAITIRSQMYNNQKYVYVLGEKQLYEVFNTGKADNPINTRLNVKRVIDTELKELVENALG